MAPFKNLPSLRHPLWLVAGVLAIFGTAAALGGAVGYFAEGGLVLLAWRGLAALALFLATARLTRFLSLTLSPELSDAIAKEPLARALLSAGVLVASGLVTLAAFG